MIHMAKDKKKHGNPTLLYIQLCFMRGKKLEGFAIYDLSHHKIYLFNKESTSHPTIWTLVVWVRDLETEWDPH